MYRERFRKIFRIFWCSAGKKQPLICMLYFFQIFNIIRFIDILAKANVTKDSINNDSV